MGLGACVASALCEHAVLTRTVRLAWSQRPPKQTWGKQNACADPHDLLVVRSLEDLAKIKTVVLDLTQLVYGFPKHARSWLLSNFDVPLVTFEGDSLEEALGKCVEGGYHIGSVDRMKSGRFVVNVDTFTDEMLAGFLFDYLLDVRRGLITLLPNLTAAYYVMDGERPAAKTTTTKKRSVAKSHGEDRKIWEQTVSFLGPDRLGLLEPARVVKDGQEMWQGSLLDYLRSPTNIWNMIDRLSSTVEQTSGENEHPVDVFVARGWHSNRHSSSGWFRVAGARPECVRPLTDYFSKTVDLEADSMMVRLGSLAVTHLDGPCLLSTSDTDVLVSLMSHGSRDLIWAKQLTFKNSKGVVVRTQRDGGPTNPTFTPDRINLQHLNPLKEPAICKVHLPSKYPNTFLFSSSEIGETSKWSTEEAKRRLCAIFIVLLGGCDFCESLKMFGSRGIVALLSQKPKLQDVCFSRVTLVDHMSKETEQGMRHDCLQHFRDKILFPWRCGNFACLVEVKFDAMEMLIQKASRKPIDGSDWKPFCRRLCYSASVLSCVGIGLERQVKKTGQLAENFGYNSQRDYEYIFSDLDECEPVRKRPRVEHP